MLCLCLLTACNKPQDTSPGGQGAIELLSLPAAEGFLLADQPRTFEFPRDHGMHQGYRTEWWYLTGHLYAGERRFGYQVTFFRFVIDPAEDADQAWEADAIWLAQVALSDLSNERFLTAEQLSRELSGVTESAVNVLDVRTNGWHLWQPHYDESTYQLNIEGEVFDLKLQLTSVKPIVLQGEQGLSRKSSADPNNASYYYSQTRLVTTGSIVLDGEQLDVEGHSWFDREWSTSALNGRQSGWDWFALQLENDQELMFYQLRLEDGSIDTASAGVWVSQQGEVTRLDSDDVDVTPTDYWRSPETGSNYPIAWVLSSRQLDLELTIKAVIPNQQWLGRFSYWEGAVDVQGRFSSETLQGQGYVELTGY